MKLNKKALMIVVSVFILQFFVITLASNLLPILQPTLMQYHGINTPELKTQFSLMYTIGVITPAFASIIIPKVYQKIGIKKSYIIGVLMTAGGFLSMALIPQNNEHPEMAIYLMWALAATFNIGISVVSSIGIPYLLNLWLPLEIRGKMMGIAFMGASIGNVTAIGLFNIINLNVNNLNSLILILGSLGLVIGLLVVLALIKEPSESEYKEIHKTEVEEKIEESDDTFKETIKSKQFMFYLIGLIFLGFYVSAMSTQYPLYFQTEIKNGSELYLKVAFIFAICTIFGNFLGGYLFDKIHAKKTIIVGFCLALIGSLSLYFAKDLPMLGFLFSVSYGLSVFSFIVLPGYMTSYLFGSKNYGQIFGICQMVFALGFALGTFIFSNIAHKVGWNIAWFCVIIFVVICYSSFMIALKLKKNN